MIDLPDFNKLYFDLLESDDFKTKFKVDDLSSNFEEAANVILELQEETLEKTFGVKFSISDRVRLNTEFLLKSHKTYDTLAYYYYIQFTDNLLTFLARDNKISVSDYYYAHEMFYTWCKVIKKRGHLELDDLPYLKLMLSSKTDESKLLAVVSIKRLLVSTEDLRSAWRSHTRYSDSIDTFNKLPLWKRVWTSIKGIKHPYDVN